MINTYIKFSITTLYQKVKILFYIIISTLKRKKLFNIDIIYIFIGNNIIPKIIYITM